MYNTKYKPDNENELNVNVNIDVIKKWLNDFDKNKKLYLDYKNKKKNKKTKKTINLDMFDIDDNDENENDEVMKAEIKKNKNNNVNNSCMILIGNHGIGKTTLIDVLLKKYDVKKITTNDIKIYSNIENGDELLLNNNNIKDILTKTKRNKIIVIDNIETITTNIEKKFVGKLIKINNEEYINPLIFIADGKHSPFLSLLKLHSDVVNIYEPTEDQKMNILVNICEKEKIYFEDLITAKYLINNIQNDYRILLQSLEDLKFRYKNESIDINDINSYLEIIHKKDKYNNIYEVTNNLFMNYKNIEDILIKFSNNKSNIPLMVHENYIKYIKTNNKYNTLKLIQNIAENISDADILDNYIFSNQEWDLQNMYGCLSCVIPSYYITHNTSKIFVKLEYTKDLNKTSTRCINKKNINKAEQKFKNYNIDDFLYAINLINKLMIYNASELDNICKAYNISLQEINSLLKIDKTLNKNTVF